MKIVIDEKACLKHKMTVEEVLMALAIRTSKNPDEVWQNLLNREIIVRPNKDGEFMVTQHWSDIIDEVLCDSTKDTDRTDEEIHELAKKVRLCFPQGTKPETNKYFRNNSREVAQHLKRFFAMYGDYSDEDILDATKRYIESFHSDYRYMKLDKYFIIKDLRKEGGDITSDLATFLDNKGTEGANAINNGDWLTTSRN